MHISNFAKAGLLASFLSVIVMVSREFRLRGIGMPIPFLQIK